MSGNENVWKCWWEKSTFHKKVVKKHLSIKEAENYCWVHNTNNGTRSSLVKDRPRYVIESCSQSLFKNDKIEKQPKKPETKKSRFEGIIW